MPPAVTQTYDGDTPQGARADVRSRSQLLVTNPDMLHVSILPCHQQFARLLAKLRWAIAAGVLRAGAPRWLVGWARARAHILLVSHAAAHHAPVRRPPRYVVVDEGHAYHGAFGAHTALVLRRLRRLCRRAHGSDPLFVMTSATMANPRQHAGMLLGLGPGEELEVVSDDGSPHGPQALALWNPPLTPDAKVRNRGGWNAAVPALRAALAGMGGRGRPMLPCVNTMRCLHWRRSAPAYIPHRQAAQQAGQQALTRTEGRATGGGTYRLRRQQMRQELREANAARRYGHPLNLACVFFWVAEGIVCMAACTAVARLMSPHSPPLCLV